MEGISVQTVYEAMSRIAPPELAEGWDNPGLLVDCGKPVRRALTALDITPAVLAEAKRLDCGLIVAHHPVIFAPLKRMDRRDVPFLLAEGGVSAICMHTNFDAAEGGVNDILAGLFGLRGGRALCQRLRPCGRGGPHRGAGAGRPGAAAPGRAVRAAAGRARRAGEVYGQRPPGAAAGRHQRGRGQPL